MADVLAAFAQFDNDVRSDRTRAGMQEATGTYTKQEILQKATQWRLTNRRGQPLSSQAIGMLLRNRLYIGRDTPGTAEHFAHRCECEGLLLEMTLREGSARARLQVALEANGPRLIRELD